MKKDGRMARKREVTKEIKVMKKRRMKEEGK